MSKKTKSLKSVAQEVFRRSLDDDWRPQSKDLRKEYGLNDPQLQLVKRYVKQIGAVKGVVWGYHEPINAYRVCPTDDSQVAKEILRYTQNHWANMGANVNLTIRAAYGQGFVTKRSAEVTSSSNRKAARDIVEGFDNLKFRRRPKKS